MSLQWIAGHKIESQDPKGADFLTVIKAIQTVSKGFLDSKKLSPQKLNLAIEKFALEMKKTSSEQSENFIQKELLHFFRRVQSLLDSPQAKRPPVGPCFIFGSRSSPLLRIIAVLTALRSGCTVVFLSSPQAMKSYISFFEKLISCGIPETSLALLTTSHEESLETLVSHPSIRAIHFMGHEQEGLFLRKNRLPLFEKKIKIHFGGKNPVIFTHDADLTSLKDLLPLAYDHSYLSEHRFNRWFVQEKNYSLFVDRVMSLDAELSVFLNQQNFKNSSNDTVLLNPNESILKEKNWKTLPVSLLPINFDFNNCSPWHQRETLQPLLTITRFKNSNEVLKFANTTNYASACAVISGTLLKAEEISQQMTMPHQFCNTLPDMGGIDDPLGLAGCGFGNEVSDQNFFIHS